MGIAWNSEKVTPEEDKLIREGGWQALTDPRWKGRMATSTPASGGSSYSFVYMFLGGKRDQFGPDFEAKIAALKPQIYESKSPMYDRLGAGEHAIVDQASQSDMGNLYLKGAPIRWVFPSPTPANLTVQTISATCAASQCGQAVPGMGGELGGTGRVVQALRRHLRPRRYGRSAARPTRPTGTRRIGTPIRPISTSII